MVGTRSGELSSLPGAVPVSYSPGLEDLASEVGDHLTRGGAHLADIFQTEPSHLKTMLLSEEDWPDAPRETERPYPFGLPYFTRSVVPPALVFPEELSRAIRPQTDLTLPLAVWHELAHAFFLQSEVVKTPLWLGEFVPQAASAAVALREGFSVDEHLSQIEVTEFTIRGFGFPASAGDQMQFQNLLLSLSVAAMEEFGDGFIARLVSSLWDETEIVKERRAEELFVASLGEGGREWLNDREGF